MQKVMRLARRAREVGARKAVFRAASVYGDSLPARVRGVALLPTALLVRERTGKSLAEQAREIRALRRGLGRLRAFDYYAYELWDDRRYTFAQKEEFVGWKPEMLSNQLNDPHWREVCDDKLLCYGLLRGLCLPHPEVYAVYHPVGRTFGQTPSLHTPQAMADFLRRDMRYPFFGKPVKDSFGGGASSVDAIDRGRDVLILRNGKEVAVDEYVATVPVAKGKGHRLKRFRSSYDSGYLFQARVVQHPLVERLSGGRVSSLRLVVLLTRDGPRLFRATWKLPVGAAITDHVIGRSSNIKCSVDPATGRVERVLRGRGYDVPEAYALGHHGIPVDVHPDTQERLTDVQLPDWERTVALCLHAAAGFPGLRYQSWDFVMGADGPLILELNFNGGVLQVPGCRGLNDAEFRRFLADWGVTLRV